MNIKRLSPISTKWKSSEKLSSLISFSDMLTRPAEFVLECGCMGRVPWNPGSRECAGLNYYILKLLTLKEIIWSEKSVLWKTYLLLAPQSLWKIFFFNYGGGGLFFYPETLAKDFKSQAWIRFFIRICEDLIFGVFFHSCAKFAFLSGFYHVKIRFFIHFLSSHRKIYFEFKSG